MCRFTLYLGPPVQLATLLTEPVHSLIHQSFHSEERAEPLNGDGFGVGWYAPRLTPDPAVFHAITPAWNNKNLASIARVVASPCVFAHVRAATIGSDVNLANCHPFTHGRYLFMHNGHVGAFRAVRRPLLESLTDEAFHVVRGSTDTEHLLALFIDEIVRSGAVGPPATHVAGGAAELGRWLGGALRRVLALVAERGGGESSFLNVAVSDGNSVAVTRFTDDRDEGPESLHLLEGELYEPAGRRFALKRDGDEGRAQVISSERLTEDDRWATVPPNSLVVLDREAPPRVLPMGLDGAVDV
jgi:predicted glutamine amidotransferase